MDAIRGPIHPVAENWGFVFEGYNTPPIYMSPWNPEYYHAFFTGAGYEKVKDLLVYDADIGGGYELPERYNDFSARFMARYRGIRIRRLDMRHLHDDARAIWEISNTALADNWGYVPLELPVMEDMLKSSRLIVDPDAVWMVEYEGKPVGFCLGFPDINILLKRINGNCCRSAGAAASGGQKAPRLPPLWPCRFAGMAQARARRADVYPPLRAPQGKAHPHGGKLHPRDNLHIKNALERLGMRQIKDV
jgi:hypothetical protein